MAINTTCNLCGREAFHQYIEFDFARDDGGKWSTYIECPRCGLYPLPTPASPAAAPAELQHGGEFAINDAR